MDNSGHLPAWLAGTAAAVVVLALVVYGFLLRRLISQRGKVRVGRLGLPDLMFAVLLGTWFLALTVSGFRHGPRVVSSSDIISGSLIYLLILAVIFFSLRSRRIRVWRLFGFFRLRFGKALGLAAALLLVAYPLIAAAFAITQGVLGLEARRQNPLSPDQRRFHALPQPAASLA